MLEPFINTSSISKEPPDIKPVVVIVEAPLFIFPKLVFILPAFKTPVVTILVLPAFKLNLAPIALDDIICASASTNSAVISISSIECPPSTKLATVAAPVSNVLEPLSILPKPLVIVPLFKAPTVTKFAVAVIPV